MNNTVMSNHIHAFVGTYFQILQYRFQEYALWVEGQVYVSHLKTNYGMFYLKTPKLWASWWLRQ